MQAIILAGGLGTRLRGEVPDRPKALAPIGDRPFFFYLLDLLRKQGIVDIVLAVGYRAEQVIEACGDGSELGLRIRYAREESPLGTGGALRNALALTNDENLLAINGDTYFDLNFETLFRYHRLWGAGVTLGLKYRKDLGRYGVTDLAPSPRETLTPSQLLTLTSSSSPNDIGRGEEETDLTPSPSPKGRGGRLDDVSDRQLYRVAGFREKPEAVGVDGYINGGVYLLRRELIAEIPEGSCSLEKEVLPGWVARGIAYGLPWGGRFIDIGVAADYREACAKLDQWVNTPKSRALFLDRDGVINEDSGYIWRKEDIRLIGRTIELIREANRDGRKVIILTNQAGIARGYYTETDMDVLHQWLVGELAKQGAVVDGIYTCPHHPEGTVATYRRNCLCRKPQPGMVLQAAEEMGIDVEGSRMIGDQETDRIQLPYLESVVLDGRGNA